MRPKRHLRARDGTKYAPSTETIVPPRVGPARGDTDTTVLACLYVKGTCDRLKPAPAVTLTSIGTRPAASLDGAMQRNKWDDTSVAPTTLPPPRQNRWWLLCTPRRCVLHSQLPCCLPCGYIFWNCSIVLARCAFIALSGMGYSPRRQRVSGSRRIQRALFHRALCE